MNRRLVHRGPDDEGWYITPDAGLGVRRLKVIDPVTGHQPIGNETGRLQVVLNGEIFNYRRLRDDLKQRGHVFRTSSDTEVIVHLYEEYGDDCVEKLNGEFAFAIWDGPRKRLLAARDRFGIKPFFYTTHPGGLIFASELKALLVVLPRSPVLDMQALDAYLSLQYVPSGMSAVKGVIKLAPAHRLVYEAEGAGLRIEPYWRFPSTVDVPAQRSASLLEQISWLLHDAVRMRMVSDVPLGAFLSGGIDSGSVVSCAVKHAGSALRTFSLGFPEQEFDESGYARMVARHCGTRHTQLKMSAHDAAGIIPDVLWYLDEPFADSSALPTYLLSQMTAQHVVVALSGDGGDELFGGYPKYGRELLYGVLRRIPGFLRLMRQVAPRGEYAGKQGYAARLMRTCARASLPFAKRYLEWGFFFSRSQKWRMCRHPLGEEHRVLTDTLKGISSGIDDCTRTMYLDARLYLPDDLLVKVDRMSMAHSLEVRVPFLDHRLVELVAGLPASLRMPGAKSKVLLKRVMRNALPAGILSRRKQGFAVPLDLWFRRELAGVVRSLLLSERSLGRGLFHPAYVRRMLDEHQRGGSDHGHRIWALFSLELWQRIYLDNKGEYRRGTKISELL